jgi:phosphohistidine phosphatase
MIKNLYLVRHAKTQQESIDNRDFSRELADRGLRDSSLVGDYCKKQGYSIDMMISSPAARALATAELMAAQMDYEREKIHTNDELYMASVRTFLQVINQLKDNWNDVMIVSHNPAVTYLGEHISDAEVGYIPTGAVMVISFEVESWAEIAQNSGSIKAYITPRKIKDGVQ